LELDGLGRDFFERAGMFSTSNDLGAGVDHAGLHSPEYDFPDQLIGIGARFFIRTLRNLLG